tara:strand:+ start:512 stop:991 length:480 start_codon:yes stop_codon:yes gene_type:complete
MTPFQIMSHLRYTTEGIGEPAFMLPDGTLLVIPETGGFLTHDSALESTLIALDEDSGDDIYGFDYDLDLTPKDVVTGILSGDDAHLVRIVFARTKQGIGIAVEVHSCEETTPAQRDKLDWLIKFLRTNDVLVRLTTGIGDSEVDSLYEVFPFKDCPRYS